MRIKGYIVNWTQHGGADASILSFFRSLNHIPSSQILPKCDQLFPTWHCPFLFEGTGQLQTRCECSTAQL